MSGCWGMAEFCNNISCSNATARSVDSKVNIDAVLPSSKSTLFSYLFEASPNRATYIPISHIKPEENSFEFLLGINFL